MLRHRWRESLNYWHIDLVVLVLFLPLVLAGTYPSLGVAWASDFGQDSNYINPRNFGSKGDGRTDDTDSIQAAIDSIPPFWTELTDKQTFPKGKVNRFTMNQPYILFFPAGTYRINRTLHMNFRNRLTLLGYGARIVWDGAESGTLFDFRNSSFLNIKGLFIDGNKRLGTAFHFGVSPDAYRNYTNSNVSGIHLEDVTVKRAFNKNRAIKERQAVIDTIGDYSRPYVTSVQDSLFENVIIETQGEIGYNIGTTEVRFVGGLISGLSESIRFYSGTSASFYGVTFTGGAGTHISIYGNSMLDSLRFYGAYFEGYKEALLKEIGKPRMQNIRMLLFDGCFFSNPAPEFISLKKKKVNLYLIGNRYYKNPKFSRFDVMVGSESNILVIEDYQDGEDRPNFLSGNVMKILSDGFEKDNIKVGFSDIRPQAKCKEGDIRFNKKPSSGGYAGWICSNTPEGLKWLEFGRISDK